MSGPWSIVETSAFDPVARSDPHGRLKELREQCPVHRDEAVKTWFLTRYGDVRETVNDRSLWRHWSRSEEGALLRRMDRDDEGDRIDSILSLDEPDHSRVRLPLAKAFYARINAMKPQIEAIIDRVIDEVPADRPFDLIADLGVPIPILVRDISTGETVSAAECFPMTPPASTFGAEHGRRDYAWGCAEYTRTVSPA